MPQMTLSPIASLDHGSSFMWEVAKTNVKNYGALLLELLYNLR
jgi:hypothetical protein